MWNQQSKSTARSPWLPDKWVFKKIVLFCFTHAIQVQIIQRACRAGLIFPLGPRFPAILFASLGMSFGQLGWTGMQSGWPWISLFQHSLHVYITAHSAQPALLQWGPESFYSSACTLLLSHHLFNGGQAVLSVAVPQFINPFSVDRH